MSDTTRKCVVELRKGITESGIMHGDRFKRLRECCGEFETWFLATGNRKATNFDYHEPSTERDKPGIHLDTRGGVMKVLLRLTTQPSIVYEGEVKSCPFCKATISVEYTESVLLKPKFTQVRAGYNEEIKWSKDKKNNEPKSATA